MKTTTIILTALLFLGCSSSETKNTPNNTTKSVKTTIKTGWSDADTYTVMVIVTDKKQAVDKAHHQILKDIVNIRVRYGSRYTDITKISEEFKTPLKKGQIIDSQKIDNGIKIYYQIRDKGLKKKFERK